MTINHKHLLSKYIQHVVYTEGTDFLHLTNMWEHNVKFTEEEKAELQEIADEMYY